MSQTAAANPAPDRLGSYDVPKLGVDAEGREHFYDETRRAVIVTTENRTQVVREAELGGRPLVAWVSYVEERVGWDVPPGHWVEMFVGALEGE